MDLYLKGLAIGFAVAAPVGAIGVLCIRRTLADGTLVGLATGLGAATADALFATVATLGLSAVASFLTGQAAWLRIVGGTILVVLGVRTFLAQPKPAAEETRAPSLAGAFGSTFVLTLTNPATIMSFAAVFASIGLAGTDPAGAATLVAGVFCGSAAWWLLLSATVGSVRSRVGDTMLRTVNRVAGVALGVLGLAAIAAGIATL